jgi:hypothetical protein
MSKLELLSIEENGGRSDCMAAQQSASPWPSQPMKLHINIAVDSSATFTLISEKGLAVRAIDIQALDIDGMIDYLKDVRDFISEEKMVSKLMGRK